MTRRAQDFFSGLVLPLYGARLLISSPGALRYILLPALFSATVYFLLFGAGLVLLFRWDPQEIGWEFWGPVGGQLSTILNYSSGFLRWIIAIPLLLVIGYFSFTTVTMIIASPFNDALSSKLLRNMRLPRFPILSRDGVPPFGASWTRPGSWPGRFS